VSTRRSPWSSRILEVLGDGAWHDREELLRAAMAVVPPGVAFRRGERDRIRWAERNLGAGPHPRTRGGRAEAIVRGRRQIASTTLGGLMWRGRVERVGEQVRLVRGEAVAS
jgi:hypothetical protein